MHRAAPWAKALAIAATRMTCILITVDKHRRPASIRNEVAQRLSKKGSNSDHSPCSSHSHTALPRGNLPRFSATNSPDHEAHIAALHSRIN